MKLSRFKSVPGGKCSTCYFYRNGCDQSNGGTGDDPVLKKLDALHGWCCDGQNFHNYQKVKQLKIK